MQNQIASTEELPGWAKTQTQTSPKTHINTDNIVAQAPVTASDGKKLINEGDPLILKGATSEKESMARTDRANEDSGDSSATELGDEALAAPLANGESEEEDAKPTSADVDSPPRPINTRSLAEERRALALRQRGQEASAAVADMRARLSALGILTDTPSKSVDRNETEDTSKDLVVKETLNEVVKKVNENLETDVSGHDLTNSTSENNAVSIDISKITESEKSSDTKEAAAPPPNENAIQSDN